MSQSISKEAQDVMNDRFHKDTLISVATIDDGMPWVRIVNTFYEEDAFYVITHAFTNKMQQIQKNKNVAICAEWFTAHAIGIDLGSVNSPENQELTDKLKEAFVAWISNGDANLEDPNTHILKIQLTDAVLFSHGTRFDMQFS